MEQAQAQLPELLARLAPNEELVIYLNGTALARMIRLGKASWPCQPGSAKDSPHWMAPDFNAPLDDFGEYME
jgi:hypothetical protein